MTTQHNTTRLPNRLKKQKIFHLISLLCAIFFIMPPSYAGCTLCSTIDSVSSCPTWCCKAGASYPVTQSQSGNVVTCSIGSTGCVEGTVGCSAPCGCE